MRKLAIVAALAAAVLGPAGTASARCPEGDLECNLKCAIPQVDPREGVYWYYC